ncbi:MAG TPA: AMP-binding protein, partial [Rubrivivax sp.]|nr:AMP-binding protein [Rubrivivax sp.]
MAERTPLIPKTAASLKPAPNMADRDATCAAFSWQQVRDELQPGGGEALNMARLAVDRHADGPRAQHTALRFIAASGAVRDLSYAGLKQRTDRFAAALAGLGVGHGDRLFVLAGRIEPLYVAVLGAL